jgi:hypothetical protein
MNCVDVFPGLNRRAINKIKEILVKRRPTNHRNLAID